MYGRSCTCQRVRERLVEENNSRGEKMELFSHSRTDLSSVSRSSHWNFFCSFVCFICVHRIARKCVCVCAFVCREMTCVRACEKTNKQMDWRLKTKWWACLTCGARFNCNENDGRHCFFFLFNLPQQTRKDDGCTYKTQETFRERKLVYVCILYRYI